MNKGKNFWAVVVAVLLMIAVWFALNGCATVSAEPQDPIEAERMKLEQTIPDPDEMFKDNENIRVQYLDTKTEYYQFYIHGVTIDDFDKYVESCREMGFDKPYYYSNFGYYCKDSDDNFELQMGFTEGKYGSESFIFVNLCDLKWVEPEE